MTLSTMREHQTFLKNDDRDLFLYGGLINHSGVRNMADAIFSSESKRKNASLVLITFGGDLSQAYLLIRYFTLRYQSFRVVVLGPCKSAGTLVTLGAHQVAIGPFGELGPIDVQLGREDELFGQQSGLDTIESLEVLQRSGFAAFHQCVNDLVKGSGGGGLSTKTACEVAARLVTGLFRPVAEQIDPTKIASIERNMRVAQNYGQRVMTQNVRDGAIEYLARKYPSHSFIIDWKEAQDVVFHSVERPTEPEYSSFGFVERLSPYDDDVTVVDVRKELDRRIESEGEKNETGDDEAGGDSYGEAGDDSSGVEGETTE